MAEHQDSSDRNQQTRDDTIERLRFRPRHQPGTQPRAEQARLAGLAIIGECAATAANGTTLRGCTQTP
jgi:hypothetical protein